MKIVEAVKSGRVLVSDGAWGTFLQQKGLRPGECPELWNLERPDDVRAIALEKGGADAICVETMSALDEATLAVKAAKENTNCEIICTFTFERTVNGDYRTMMGVSPEQAAEEMLEEGTDIIGANCGNGIERMVDVVKALRAAAPDTPILVHANAGLPRNVDGVDVFPESPEEMAGRVPELIAAGANIIGGCCGTTPAHVAAIKARLS